MRMVVILLLVGSLQVSAKVHAQTIHLQEQNVSLKKVFKQIEKQSDYYFVYRNEWLKQATKVDVNVQKATIQEVMSIILAGQPLSYSIVDKNVVIERKAPHNSEQDVTKQVLAPPLKGVVVDSATRKPLAGVSIKIKGTTMGTTTDADGAFSLDVQEDDVLEVSYLGYTAKMVPVQGKENIQIMLSTATTGLNQLVVVGYGTQKKKDVTGSISQINFDDEGLDDIPVTNVAKAIQGRIPNLNVSFGSGRPGVGGSLNVRGYNSINGGGPLVLVDGVEQSINNLNPNDVKSVTVLKDAGAQAIYGARAAYGVILVETKSGKPGKPRITYSTNYGVATPGVKTDFITTGYDEVMLWDEAMKRTLGISVTGYTDHDYEELKARRNDKTPNPERPWALVENRNGRDRFVYYGNFDWWNYMYRKYQPYHKHALSISGKGDKVSYYISGDMRKQAGIWKLQPDPYNGQHLRAKVGADLFPWLKISNNASFYHYKYEYSRFNTFNFGRMITDFYSPSYMPFNPDGTSTSITGMGPYQIGYQVHTVLQDGHTKYDKSFYEFRNTTALDFTFLKNKLQIHADYTLLMNQTPQSQRRVKVPYSLYPGEVGIVPRYDQDRLLEKEDVIKKDMFNAYATYKHTIDKHYFSVMVGGNQAHKQAKMTQGIAYDLLSERLNDLSLGTGDPEVTGSQYEWDILGFFGRVNYNYDSKYYFSFNGRYDGTSRFPKNDRFGFFPSLSVAWVPSEEAFFEDIKNTINHLKLRFSYGSLGNQSVGVYAYIPEMSTATGGYIIDGSKITYTRNPSPVSSSLTWEKVYTKNIGLDVSLLDSRFIASIDGYIRDTKGMLSRGRKLPAIYGATEPKENAADLRTKGWEMSFTWQDAFELAQSTFSYRIKLGVSDYTGEIKKFYNPENLISEYYAGHKLGDIWGFVVDGYFQTQQEADNYPVNQTYVNRRIEAAPGEWLGLRPGDLKFVDLDGDNVIGVGQNKVDDHGDRKIIGNSTPRYKYGLSLSAKWLNIDFSAFFQGVVSQDWYPGKEAVMFWGPYARPYTSFIPTNFKDKIWSVDNPNSYFPLLRGYIANNGSLYYANNKYLQNLGYIRLKNLSIGYSIPEELLKKLFVKKLRVYFSGDDLFTLSRLDTKYIDPEQVGGGDYNHSKDDGRKYPFSSKMFSFGLDITF